MARTLRRGTPSRNLRHYLQLGEIWHEARLSGGGYSFWKVTWDDSKSYAEYVAGEVRRYHQDKRSRGLPRIIRKIDVNRQRREHEHLIHQALRSGDFDVALSALGKHASWAYW